MAGQTVKSRQPVSCVAPGGQGSSTRTQKTAEEILGGSNVPEPSVLISPYRKLGWGGRNGRQWHGGAAAYQGRGLHEPPKSRSRSRFRINLQRPLDLSSERDRVPQGKSGGFNPGSHRVRARVRVICSAAFLDGQGRVVQRHSGAGIAVCAWSCSRCQHRC